MKEKITKGSVFDRPEARAYRGPPLSWFLAGEQMSNLSDEVTVTL